MSAFPARSALLAALVAAAGLATAQAADIARGRGLYELRCDGCHSESVHGRAHRVARNPAEVRTWVQRWNANLHLNWGDEEIDDVVAFLDTTYYRFPCDTPACRAVSLAHAAPR